MSRYTIEYSRERGPQGASGSTDASAITSGTLNAARLPATVVQTTGTYANPAWITELASTKITGTLTKLQQHAQTAYLDAAGTWAQAQTFSAPLTVNHSASDVGASFNSNAIRINGSSFAKLGFEVGSTQVSQFFINSGVTIFDYAGDMLIRSGVNGPVAMSLAADKTATFNGSAVFGNGSSIGRSGIDNLFSRITYVADNAGVVWGRIDVENGFQAGLEAVSGQIALRQGDASNSGYLDFYKTNGDRRGYFGFDANSSNDISFTNEQSGIFSFNKGATFNGNVGIGGAAEDFALDVSGANGIRVRGSTGAVTIVSRNGTDNAILYQRDNAFRIFGAGSDRFILNTNNGGTTFSGAVSAASYETVSNAQSGLNLASRNTAENAILYVRDQVFSIYAGGSDRFLINTTNGAATFNGNVGTGGKIQLSNSGLGFGFALTNGNAQLYTSATAGLIIAGAGSSTDLLLTNKSGGNVFSIPTGTVNADFVGSVTSASTGKLGDFTVATLPSAATYAGYECNVTDSSVTTFGSTVAGGGSSRVKLYSNGTNWTVQAA